VTGFKTIGNTRRRKSFGENPVHRRQIVATHEAEVVFDHGTSNVKFRT
jgi:hypothetical protein